MSQEMQYPAKPPAIPDGAPEDWPLSAKQASKVAPGNLEVYEQEENTRWARTHPEEPEAGETETEPGE